MAGGEQEQNSLLQAGGRTVTTRILNGRLAAVINLNLACGRLRCHLAKNGRHYTVSWLAPFCAGKGLHDETASFCNPPA